MFNKRNIARHILFFSYGVKIFISFFLFILKPRKTHLMAHGSILVRFIFWTCMNATQLNIFKVRLKIDGVDTNSDSLFNGDTKLLLLIGSILIRYTDMITAFFQNH
jgi:hypothetical protein